MTIDDEPPSLAERYARATGSSQLRVRDRRGDVDYLIAAGWLQDGLGVLLFRLRDEYDAVRADIMSAGGHAATWEERAARADAIAQAWRPPMVFDQRVAEEPERIRREASGYLLTQRALALINLRTLRSAREALGSFAIVLATRHHFMRPDAEAALLAGQVLDVWLDDICHHCCGRGYNGGAHRGEQRVSCRPCRSTGKRSAWVGRDIEQRRYASLLLLEIAQHHAHVEKVMKRYLAAVGVDPEPDAGRAALAVALQLLNDPEAQED